MKNGTPRWKGGLKGGGIIMGGGGGCECSQPPPPLGGRIPPRPLSGTSTGGGGPGGPGGPGGDEPEAVLPDGKICSLPFLGLRQGGEWGAQGIKFCHLAMLLQVHPLRVRRVHRPRWTSRIAAEGGCVPQAAEEVGCTRTLRRRP